ncbi:co-chaperonin GroES [Planktothrix phage Pra-JY27]|nr:chaperonin GroES [Planktothrix phage Pag-Yong1]WEV89287.1 co-chaperonin GroES [Synechococcus phage MinM2]
MYDAKSAEATVERAAQLPDPVGYHLLVALPEVEEKTAGGIIRPDETRRREETAAIVGFVVKMGADCYADRTVFPGGPWCKNGDWVVFRPYSGLRLVVHGKEFRLLKDSEIDAVVLNPAGVIRSSRV